MSTSTARSLDRDFEQLHASAGNRSMQQPQQQGRSNIQPAMHPFKNGLATFKPVVYPNPGLEDSSSEEEEEPVRGSAVHVASSYQRPAIFNTASSISHRPQIASSVAVGSGAHRLNEQGLAVPHYTAPLHPMTPGKLSYAGMEPPVPAGLTNSPSTHSYASIDSRDQDSLFDEQEYLPPPLPNRVMHGSQGSHRYMSHTSSTVPAHRYMPQSASSRLVYSTTKPIQGGLAASRPFGAGTDQPAPPAPAAPVPASIAEDPYAQLQLSYTQSGYGDQGSVIPSPTKEPKEAEVDALTSLLMQNMKAAAEPDFFGVCGYCDRPIKGEKTGCSALGKAYHMKCFKCEACGSRLDGQPFYAMEQKPYCEGCYMNTLEKCSVCSKAITDRVLRATGKPYHPSCFVCVVCGLSLDGVPFTVDATNQIHCIEDFHNKFAPRCCVCNHPIMPTQGKEESVRIVALDRSFHVNCYKCEDCGIVLSSESEGRGCYPLDDHILCKSCNARRIQAMTTKMTTEL